MRNPLELASLKHLRPPVAKNRTASLMEAQLQQTSTAAPSARVLWVDLARGLGILLVVLGHVNRGLYDGQLHSSSNLYQALDDALYLFHMPLFFMLSGLFMTQSVRKVGVGAFVISRIRTLAYPAVLWTWLLGLAHLAVGPAANHPLTPDDFPLIPLPPYSLYWFLWALLLNQVALAPLVTHIDFRNPIHGLGLVALSFGCWVGSDVVEHIEPFGWIAKALFHLPFILAGAAFRQLSPRVSSLSGMLVLAALLLTVLNSSTLITDPLLKPLGGLLAASALMIATRAYAHSEAMPPALLRSIASLGRESMTIYLSHVLFTAATRALLSQLDVDSLAIHLLAGLCFGLAASWLIARTAKRLRVHHLLGFT